MDVSCWPSSATATDSAPASRSAMRTCRGSGYPVEVRVGTAGAQRVSFAGRGGLGQGSEQHQAWAQSGGKWGVSGEAGRVPWGRSVDLECELCPLTNFLIDLLVSES